MKIRYGCTFGSDNIVVIQISEEIDNRLLLANALRQVLQKENIRRVQKGEQRIAYKITTSEKLGEQFSEVADGSFRLQAEDEVIQEADMGITFWGSNPVLGVE